MKVVNDGMPEVIYKALCNDKYDPGDSDYTPSSLNEPAYLRRLKKEFGDQVEEPASSRVWALIGSSVHYMIELAEEGSSNTECERRFYGTIDTGFGPFKIGSQVDILDHDKNGIFDMKVTSSWSYGKGVKPEWESQLNVGRWCIFQETGQLVDNLNIVAIWRDWQMSKKDNPDYPSSQVSLIEVPVWDMGRTHKWIMEQVIDREIAMTQDSIADVLPCTEEEMWAKPSKWAVVKEKGGRATKVFDLERSALEYVSEKPQYIVEKRHGARTRCEGYCPVAKFCPSYQQHLKKFGGKR